MKTEKLCKCLAIHCIHHEILGFIHRYYVLIIHNRLYIQERNFTRAMSICLLNISALLNIQKALLLFSSLSITSATGKFLVFQLQVQLGSFYKLLSMRKNVKFFLVL